MCWLVSNKKNRGNILVMALVFGTVAFTMITLGITSYALFESKASNRKYDRDIAFHIAEAGINYYRWHLAHNPTDYYDGQGEESAGPYEHEYLDKDGNLIGYFSLDIDPPLSGSTVVVVRSTGWTVVNPSTTRTIQVRVGFPSWADYTFLSNANMNFSYTTEVHGTVHSNGGIRFDGTTDSWVKSAKDRYQYLTQWHDGVWGGGGPKSFWVYPVPAIDFDLVSGDMSKIMEAADEDGGLHLYTSGKEGWHLVFAEDGTYDLYVVNNRDCYNGQGEKHGKWWVYDQNCFDIKTEDFVSTDNLPANGMIFSDDHVWVEGVVDGRITIAAGRFPVQEETYMTIIVNNNLTYKEKAADDVIGLMAQGNVIVPYETPDIMEINAAMLSQYGAVHRPYYDGDLKDTLTIFGSQISFAGGGWKYVSGWGHVISGYENTNHSYDGNLKYYPPPGFPTGNSYELISWEEIL
ncbi:MAG TPA: pilus assembly PilX N-terminal domain-containing protein [Patescibacteria group bacterium]|nr:pilus assembly PilX N-terminal domain-containing protein [Patescibacteria group bacterium]